MSIILTKDELSGGTLIPNAPQVSAIAESYFTDIVTNNDILELTATVDELCSHINNLETKIITDFCDPLSAKIDELCAYADEGVKQVSGAVDTLTTITSKLSYDLGQLFTASVNFGMYFNTPNKLKLPTGVLYWNNHLDEVCAKMTNINGTIDLLQEVVNPETGETNYTVIDTIADVYPAVKFIPENTILSSSNGFIYTYPAYSNALSSTDLSIVSSNLTFSPMFDSSITGEIQNLINNNEFKVYALTCGATVTNRATPSTSEIPQSAFCPAGITNPLNADGEFIASAYLSPSIKLVENTTTDEIKTYNIYAIGKSHNSSAAYVNKATNVKGKFGAYRVVKMPGEYVPMYLSAEVSSDITSFKDKTQVVIPEPSSVIRTADNFYALAGNYNSKSVIDVSSTVYNHDYVTLHPGEALVIDAASTGYGTSNAVSGLIKSFYIGQYEVSSTKVPTIETT